MTKQTSPFIRVTINRGGFHVLDVRLMIVGCEDTKGTAIMLLSNACKATDNDSLKWLDESYDKACTKYIANADDGAASFYVNDDLVTITRYDEYTIY